MTRGIAQDPRRRAILRFLAELSKEFSFRLIAEGIESAEDLDVCSSEGVDAAQGYFLARPAAEPPRAFAGVGPLARLPQDPPFRRTSLSRKSSALRPPPRAPLPLRLDVWLDVACVFPTRSQAKAACEGGKVDVNGDRGKPHREIRPGDRIALRAARRDRAGSSSSEVWPSTRSRKPRRANSTRTCTPPLAPEILEARRLDRLLAPRGDAGRPDKRVRRERIRWKRS